MTNMKILHFVTLIKYANDRQKTILIYYNQAGFWYKCQFLKITANCFAFKTKTAKISLKNQTLFRKRQNNILGSTRYMLEFLRYIYI